MKKSVKDLKAKLGDQQRIAAAMKNMTRKPVGSSPKFKWTPKGDNRPHRFDPKTMGKDKNKAGLEYWNRKLQTKPTDGSTPKRLTWKEIKASEGYKKGEFNKFYANRPKNLTEARDRFEARRYWSRKITGNEKPTSGPANLRYMKPLSWKEIKANKKYKKGGYQDRLKKKRRQRSSIVSVGVEQGMGTPLTPEQKKAAES